jgi:outer membrane receptor for ferrienterochelin and colicins
MHIRIKAFLYIFSALSFSALAQEPVLDTIKQLDEVVVTGQIEPQSINKSVFNVRTISRDDIKRQAANNLADVLNQYLNITVTPNASSGRSTVSMFGLDSQYLKILVDNIPLVSDTGLGNNIDLTQINLDDVDHIEIIEGSMGVTHGANAVSGIINIITRKTTQYKWEISATAQEESIGDEYAPLYDRGRHIQALRAAYSISPEWYVSVGANRNDFEGFRDTRGGRDYTDYDPDNITINRGYSWLPKEQYFTNALVRYQKGNFRLFYKFDYFNENVDFYNPIVQSELVTGVGLLRLSQDSRFFTEKFYHHLNGVGKVFGDMDYNVSVSHQRQQRQQEDFNYYIQTGQETNNNKYTYQDTEILYSTGTLSNFLKSRKYDFQLGYELVNTNGFNSSASGLFGGGNQEGVNTKQRLENYDVFAAAELALTDRFSVRPGYRYSFQSKFEDQWSASMGLRYLFDRSIEARASYGRSYRTPNYDELYTYFVDSNHNVQGNPDLIPETSNSVEASLKKTTIFSNGVQISNNIIASYMSIDDRIELVLAATVPTWQYKYTNIDEYKMWNISTAHQLNYKNWMVRAGFSFLAISKTKNTGSIVSDDRFLNTVQANASVAYTVPQWNTVFSVFYKLNGKQPQFIETSVDGQAQFVLQQIQSFSMMDASVKKTFFSNKLDATIGARNLFNIINVQSNVASATTHDAGSTNILMGYGRSYFVKLTYNLNF